MTARKRHIMGYREAIRWLVDNDDNDWLSYEDDPISVSAALVADIFDRSNDEVRRDLRRAIQESKA